MELRHKESLALQLLSTSRTVTAPPGASDPRQGWCSPSVRYQILRRISEGGMAEVFLAREAGTEKLERLVAVKRILPALASDTGFVEMLEHEAQIQARLNHSNIVQLFELGRDQGGLYLVMEYVDGADARQIMRSFVSHQRTVPVAFACRMVADALAGLQHAHEQCDAAGHSLGLVHRDVSPPNIMVSRDGIVKLLDFGIVKSNLMITRAHQLKGKFAYMSPEQVRAEPLDARSDLFAAGAILWECLKGFPLFARESIEETMRAVLSGAVPALNQQIAGVSPRVDEIIQRAVARDRTVRYQAAEEMRVDLESLMRDERMATDALTMRRMVRELLSRDGNRPRNAGGDLAGIPTAIMVPRRTQTLNHFAQEPPEAVTTPIPIVDSHAATVTKLLAQIERSSSQSAPTQIRADLLDDRPAAQAGPKTRLHHFATVVLVLLVASLISLCALIFISRQP